MIPRGEGTGKSIALIAVALIVVAVTGVLNRQAGRPSREEFLLALFLEDSNSSVGFFADFCCDVSCWVGILFFCLISRLCS